MQFWVKFSPNFFIFEPTYCIENILEFAFKRSPVDILVLFLFDKQFTVSNIPPFPKAITGEPEAIASIGAMPKSSTPAINKGSASAQTSHIMNFFPRNLIFDSAIFSSLDFSGPSPIITVVILIY